VEIKISDFIKQWSLSEFKDVTSMPWIVTNNLEQLIKEKIKLLGNDYQKYDGKAIHKSSTIEQSAILKGPMIIKENVFVAANAYLRGGVYLDSNCIVGPCCELKTTMLFSGAKIAHLSFVGDSILGSHTNIEAGAMIANYRNEMTDKQIRFHYRESIIETGIDKFGALLGDNVRIGANAVIAPGVLLEPNQKLTRGGKIDLHPDAL